MASKCKHFRLSFRKFRSGSALSRQYSAFMTFENKISTPSEMDGSTFVTTFGSIFEHSAWIAEGAVAEGLGTDCDTCEGLHDSMAAVFRNATYEQRLGVLNAHPDLAGKLAAAKRLTAESTNEQASAGLDALTDDERAQFTELNDAYKTKFGFPFIIAVKGLNKAQILEAFVRRVEHDRDAEFATACEQVEKIALLRLRDLLPSREMVRGASNV